MRQYGALSLGGSRSSRGLLGRGGLLCRTSIHRAIRDPVERNVGPGRMVAGLETAESPLPVCLHDHVHGHVPLLVEDDALVPHLFVVGWRDPDDGELDDPAGPPHGTRGSEGIGAQGFAAAGRLVVGAPGDDVPRTAGASVAVAVVASGSSPSTTSTTGGAQVPVSSTPPLCAIARGTGATEVETGEVDGVTQETCYLRLRTEFFPAGTKRRLCVCERHVEMGVDWRVSEIKLKILKKFTQCKIHPQNW